MRAVRFAAQLGFEIEAQTINGIRECKDLLRHISKERIRDEFLKICISPRPEYINELYRLELLEYIVPEFIPAYDVAQNHPHHIYNVAQHTIVAMQNSVPDVILRLTLLLHDIGKIYTKTTDKKGIDHFYNHPEKSVEIAKKVLRELKMDNQSIKSICALILYHDYHLRGKMDKVLVKKVLTQIGPDLFDTLLLVQEGDVRAQNPDKLQPKLKGIVLQRAIKEEVIANNEPYNKAMLAITGQDLIEQGIPRGAIIGQILDQALEHVIHKPEQNTKVALLAYCEKVYSHL